MNICFGWAKLPFSTLMVYAIISASLLYNCDNGGGTQSKIASSQKFKQIPSSQSGIDFQNKLIDNPLDQRRNVMDFPNYFNGAGTAIADFDNDGLSDIFLVGNEEPNKIYRNTGNLKFENKTSTANVNASMGWRNGVTVVDVNNDGFQDIYVCHSSTFREAPNVRTNSLYINNGDFTFTEKAAEYGLNSSDFTHQVSFFDYDLDGDLDCFMLNTSIYVNVNLTSVFRHLESDKRNLEAASCKLYENKNGKYVDITEQAGMLRYGFGLGVVTSDINNDGYPDVYVANDYSVPDFMYINNQDGTFSNKTKEMTNQISFYAMGADIADINNDGHVDIGVVDMAADDHVRDKTLMVSMNVPNFRTYVDTLKYQYQYMFNSIQLNNGNGTFSNIVNLAGLAKTDWSWASLFADFDNDSYKDYFVTNGYKRYARDNDSRLRMKKVREESPNNSVPIEMRKELYDQLPSIKLKNTMFKNNQDLTFSNVSDDWGLDAPTFSSGAAYGDLDNDGDLDLVINNTDGEAMLYQNNATGNHLRFKLKPNKLSANVQNTKIQIHYGEHTQFAEYTPVRGFLSSMEQNFVHFGLGGIDNVEKVIITWPNGKRNVLSNVKANTTIEIEAKPENKGQLARIDRNETEPIFEVVTSKSGISYKHYENFYDDFEKEILLPHKQSTLGPKLATADVNGDGLEDLFIGGAKNYRSKLYLQTLDGSFVEADKQPWDLHTRSEDVNAHFFDFDSDGDVDLYVCSGGGGDFKPNDALLSDRLYENDGKGNFSSTKNILPQMNTVSSVAKSCDYDQDGDLDLFVGGRSVPGKYPYAERSYILNNNEGQFTDVTLEIATDLEKPGLVTDALWVDLDGDKKQELVVSGEWMNIKVLKVDGGKFEDVSDSYGVDDLKGWWYSLAAADIDNDGDMDLICGNNSPNTKFKASKKKPFNVFADDFDGNGSCDIVLSKEYKGELVPTRGRECSSQQMPFIKEKFKSYNGFANATMKDIYGDKLKSALHLEVNSFYSSVLINKGGEFEVKKLPNQAQVAPINGIITTDINKDGNIDLIVAGNNFDTEVETARYDAGTGLIVLGDGKGNFSPLSIAESGLFANQNAKDIKLVKGAQGAYIVVANNNGPVQVFQSKGSSRKALGSTF